MQNVGSGTSLLGILLKEVVPCDTFVLSAIHGDDLQANIILCREVIEMFDLHQHVTYKYNIIQLIILTLISSHV